ncbi:MAG TPA: hypothetical protein VFS85_02370 [Dongiaceae bacterium]|jgi:hypothetical protein|nr:hypothetical protein [Dongiaceae bacterium]
MKPAAIRPDTKPKVDIKDRIVRWVGFAALAALLAMATLPASSAHRDMAAANTMHWSSTWRG